MSLVNWKVFDFQFQGKHLVLHAGLVGEFLASPQMRIWGGWCTLFESAKSVNRTPTIVVVNVVKTIIG